VDLVIWPEPTEDERQAIVAALAAASVDAGRTSPAAWVVDPSPCVAAAETTLPVQPTSRSAPSA